MNQPYRHACPFCHSQNMRRRASGGFYCRTNGHRVPDEAAIDLKHERMPERTLEYDRSGGQRAAERA